MPHVLDLTPLFIALVVGALAGAIAMHKRWTKRSARAETLRRLREGISLRP